jgi:hypothetical protein
MKKLLIVASLLLAITGIGFAQTTPAKPAQTPKTETKKEPSTTHHHSKNAKGTKEKEKAKEPKQG